MNSATPAPLQSDATEHGEQTLMPGVAPISQRQRLEWTLLQPLGAKRPQRPCDQGLFDLNARNQLEMF